MTRQPTVPVFDGLTVVEHADRMSEAVRAINHLSRLAGSIPEPATIYRIVMHMETASRQFPQALGQLDWRLAALAEDPGVVGLSAAARSPLEVSYAVEHANALADALQWAGQCLGRLSLAPGDGDPREGGS